MLRLKSPSYDQLLGLDDGQIEGWRVMLERNVSDGPSFINKQDLILICVVYFFSLLRKRECSRNMPSLGMRKD